MNASQPMPRADNRALIVEAILREVIAAERWMTVELCWEALLKVNRMHADRARELDRFAPDANAGMREPCAGMEAEAAAPARGPDTPSPPAVAENPVYLACCDCGKDYQQERMLQLCCRPCEAAAREELERQTAEREASYREAADRVKAEREAGCASVEESVFYIPDI